MTAKATQYSTRIVLKNYKNSSSVKISPTIVAGDFKVSIDGGVLINLTNLPVESPVGSGLILLTLTASEMNGDVITIIGIDQSAKKEWADLVFSINTAYSGITLPPPEPSTSLAGVAFTTDDFARNIIDYVDGNRLNLHTDYGFKWTAWSEQSSYTPTEITKGNQLLANGCKFGVHATVVLYRETHTPEQTWLNIIKPIHDAIVSAFGVVPDTFANHNEYKAIVPDPDLMAYLQTKGYKNIRIAADNEPSVNWLYDGTNQITNCANLSNMLVNGFIDIHALLEQAISENKILVIMSHTIGTTHDDLHFTEELLMQTINFVVSNNMKFYHMNELVPSLFNL